MRARAAAIWTAWLIALTVCLSAGAAWAEPPRPLTAAGHEVTWWFAFKFNAATLPTDVPPAERTCPFGGAPQTYRSSQAYVFADSEDPMLRLGPGLIGTSDADPLGATYGQVWRGDYHYVVWNDQFDLDGPAYGGGYGHSKGMIAWDDDGEGFLLQVSTPAWPGAADADMPRLGGGNTLGCVERNNVLVSQHFFAVKLTHADLLLVLRAMIDVRVGTDPENPRLVHGGGPLDVGALVEQLGEVSNVEEASRVTLSSGVIMMAKPRKLNVAPWQLVSSLLGDEPLRAATWSGNPNQINTTTARTRITCWPDGPRQGLPVQVARSGTWAGVSIGLMGIASKNGNHAKIGVSLNGAHTYAIFGDLNQQGVLFPKKGRCNASQNGRGGLFFAVDNPVLSAGILQLISGETLPAARAPAPRRPR